MALFLSLALVLSAAAAADANAKLAPAQAPWLNAALPIPQRVALLMDEMTLTERARQT